MSATLETAAVMAAIVSTVTGVFFAARSSARESTRRHEAAIEKAVNDATVPLLSQIADLRVTTRDQARRIDQLEDELRRGRGHGDNNTSRQPPDG